MAQSTRSVSSDRTIRPSDSSSLSYFSADVSNDERLSSSSSLSSLSSLPSPSSRCVPKAPLPPHQSKPRSTERYLLYPPSVSNGSNGPRRRCQHHHAEKRRSDKTIVDVIDSYGCSTDISPKQKKRPTGIVGAAVDVLKKPSTIKIVNAPAGNAILSTTNQITLPLSDDGIAIRDEISSLTEESKDEPPSLSATYQGRPQYQSKPLPKAKGSRQMNPYPSIKVTEKNGIKIKRYPMRKDSLESKIVSNSLSPLSSLPPLQNHMPYSPLGIHTSFTTTTNTNDDDNQHQQYPINVSPASTCTSGRTTATRPATPLDPASPMAVYRASRSLQQHVSVWENYDDDDDEGYGEEGERKGLIGRVKGRVSRSLVFGKRSCGPRSVAYQSGRNKSERAKHGGGGGGHGHGHGHGHGNSDSDDNGKWKKEDTGNSAESKRRVVRRWGCGYF